MNSYRILKKIERREDDSDDGIIMCVCVGSTSLEPKVADLGCNWGPVTQL